MAAGTNIAEADCLRLAPFFVVAAALTALNVWFQTHGSGEVIRAATFSQRLVGAGGVVWFYLSKALLPLNLTFIYPDWQVETAQLLWWFPLACALVVTIALWARRDTSWGKALVCGWGFFCVALAPVMGFTDTGFMKYALVADHYQHIALIGVVVLVAACAALAVARIPGRSRWIGNTVCVAAVLTLGVLSWRQSEWYSDAVTLYRTILQKNPTCWLAYNNLGGALTRRGQVQEGIEAYQQVLQFRPEYALARSNLGLALDKQGKVEEAIVQYREAIKADPNFPDAHFNLGNALFKTHRLSEAIDEFNIAQTLEPYNSDAHFNLGNALAKAGRPQEAIEHYQQAVKIDPKSLQAQNNLGNALARAGRSQEAIEHLEAAVRLQPDSAIFHNNLGVTLADLGRFPEAIEQYQQAIQLDGNYVGAYFNLAKASAELNHAAEAIAAAERGLALAQAAKQTALFKQIEAWLKSYRAHASDSANQ